MKRILLTQGKFALVDDEDYERISKYKWYLSKYKNTCYARRNKSKNEKEISMHRMIMNCPYGFEIDHINHNGLDNRKQNLRICKRWQNNGNQRKTRGTSQYKGVYWHKERKKWVAKICLNKKFTHLGNFDNELEAAQIYNKAAIKYWGIYAELN